MDKIKITFQKGITIINGEYSLINAVTFGISFEVLDEAAAGPFLSITLFE